MIIVRPLKSVTLTELKKKINQLVIENNRKNQEIRQIKSKLRTNAHYHRV